MSQAALRLVASNDQVPTFKEDYTYEQWVQDLQGVVWSAFIRGHRSLEDIAVEANLAQKTVENFAWGQTKRPASTTTFALAKALGFRMPLIDARAPRQPDEPDLSGLHQLIRKR